MELAFDWAIGALQTLGEMLEKHAKDYEAADDVYRLQSELRAIKRRVCS